MKNLSSALLAELSEQYGSDPQVVVRFRERKYGEYDAGDESYTVILPTMEGRLTNVDSFSFRVNEGSNTVACSVTFEICDTTEAILSDINNVEFSKLDSCLIGFTAAGSTAIEYIFRGFLADPIIWNNDKKSFSATFTSDYTKRKVGYVFTGQESLIKFPNRKAVGESLPTAFGKVLTSPATCIQTGCIGYLATNFTFSYALQEEGWYNLDGTPYTGAEGDSANPVWQDAGEKTAYPKIYPKWVKITGLNVDSMTMDAEDIDFGGDQIIDTDGNFLVSPDEEDPLTSPEPGTEYRLFCGGLILTAYAYPSKPHMLKITEVYLEISKMVTLPKISMTQYRDNKDASCLPVVGGGGWFVENMFIGVPVHLGDKELATGDYDTVMKTMLDNWLGGDADTPYAFTALNYAINQVKAKINFFDKFTSAGGGPLTLKWVADDALVEEESPTYLSPLPPEEVERITLGRLVFEDLFMRPDIEFKKIRDEFLGAVDIDGNTTNVRVASGTPLCMVDKSTDKFVPDIYVLNHTKTMAGAYTGIPADTKLTVSVPNLYYKINSKGVDLMKYIQQRYYSDSSTSDYNIVVEDTTTFDGAATATVATIDVPVALFGGRGVYCDIESGISSNTAEQLRRIIEIETGFEVDETSFAQAATDCAMYPSNFTLVDTTARAGAIKVCSEIAYQANLALILCAAQAKALYLASARSTVGTISRAEVIQGSIEINYKSPQDTTTLFIGEWTQTMSSWERRTELFKILKRTGNELAFYQNEQRIDFYIYNVLLNVNKSLNYIALQEGTLWARLRIKLPMFALKYEVFDYVNIELPDIQDGIGVVEEITFNPTDRTVDMQLRMNMVSGE